MRFGTLVVEEEGGRRRAAGVFSGQVDEGEGVDEQQAARGQRQGHGGSWRLVRGRPGWPGPLLRFCVACPWGCFESRVSRFVFVVVS